MENWRDIIEKLLSDEKNKVADLSVAKKSVNYSGNIKHNRELKSLTGDEEIVRAYLINRLVNELDYKPENIETEKEYTIKGGHSKLNPRNDLVVRDYNGNPFFFIELKAPDRYEQDKLEIEGQLFSLAQAEEKDFKTKVRYLVYYTIDISESALADKAIVIDFEKYKTYADWEKDGFISIGAELTAGYGEPKKQPYVKGHEKHDLKVKINRVDIEGLGRNLHNVLWGGGGINDSEIFYSLVNIILAKIQDEYEKEDDQEYDFQVYQYGNNTESPHKIYERVNQLYKRALTQQMNILEQQKIDDDNVINRNKFPLSKLVYTVQSLESFSFLEGRSSLDGKDILGDFFESITRDGFKQNKGQFFTPVPIVNFLLYALQLDHLAIDRLNNDRELPLIIDPSGGSGTYLVEAMKLLTKELKYKQQSKIKKSRQVKQRFEELFTPDHNENKWAREYLYGSEINFDLGTASKVNMILHGDGSTNIFVKDGLLPFRCYEKNTMPNYMETANADKLYNDLEVNGKFDVVVSNPPFSVDLDTQTQREVKKSFLFGDKKNSENLFIERYYQLLKEGGRLAVVLPESVFDTADNKYIRLFIFKYFIVKAVISLPQITFEPFTSTKTSLLFAQKKTSADVEKWNSLWLKYTNKWSLLKTRIHDYVQFFVDGAPLNKKWAKDVVDDITTNNITGILENIKMFLKNYIVPEDNDLEIKNLLIKYSTEILNISKHEKETDVFGYCNAWWVFGEVSKEIDYPIYTTEAENIGYKRTKRGVNPMPNDLYDIEYAPMYLNVKAIIAKYDDNIRYARNFTSSMEEDLESLKKKNHTNKSVTLANKIDKLSLDIAEAASDIASLEAERSEVNVILITYYENNQLKDIYKERTDVDLISHFKSGVLSKYKSEDIALRTASKNTILDVMRQEIIW